MISFLIETTIASYFQLDPQSLSSIPRGRGSSLSNAAIYGPLQAIDIDREEVHDE
jgi:hypothetical protein